MTRRNPQPAPLLPAATQPHHPRPAPKPFRFTDWAMI